MTPPGDGPFAVVTGGASGLGLALVREFAGRGASVGALDLDAGAIERLARERPAVRAERADVADPVAFRAALDAVCGPRTPTVFVNNAGLASFGPFASADPAVAERLLRVNLHAVVAGTRWALERMSEGTIVNISSMAAALPSPNLAVYAASKAAVAASTRALQLELEYARRPIRTLLVRPGFLDTALLRQPGAREPGPWGALIASPERAAARIVDAIESGREEVVPDWGGRLMGWIQQYFPELARRGAKNLLCSPP